MKILVVSDLHYESQLGNRTKLIELLSPADVIILAGDIAPVCKLWFEDIVKDYCDKYSTVIHILGNHCYWGSAPTEVTEKLGSLQQNYSNYHVLERSNITIDNVTFAGATTWFPDTPDTRLFQMYMNDFKYIKDFVPWVYEQNEKSIEFWETVEADIWISHYGVSNLSVSKKYKGDKLNCYFIEPVLGNLIGYKQPKYMIHGHCHNSSYYNIGETIVICNPYGYETYDGRELNRAFHTHMIINTSKW